MANLKEWTIKVFDYTTEIEIPEEVKWNTVEKFSGSGSSSTKSRTFEISKNRFRIIFEFQKKEFSVFSFFVYRLGDGHPFEIIDSDDKEGITYIYEGNGEFYIEFNIANVGSWSIEIQEPA